MNPVVHYSFDNHSENTHNDLFSWDPKHLFWDQCMRGGVGGLLEISLHPLAPTQRAAHPAEYSLRCCGKILSCWT